jgi:hypothetical protein
MMKRKGKFFGVFLMLFSILLLNQAATAQAREEYTGSAISFNGPRVATAFFNLRINGRTSDDQARRYLGVLQESGQDRVLESIRQENLGTFSVGNRVGRNLNVVHESMVDGKRRLFIVFERWTQFAELRGGYRSLDYPFGVIELFIDPNTGRGEGTYIAAARIRFDRNNRTGLDQVEIKNFATYPVKLTNVRLVGR